MGKTRNEKNYKLFKTLVAIILIVALIFVYNYYQQNNFNDFTKSEATIGISEFTRDNAVKYSDRRSYKIESKTNNDAMFSKKISVDKNTPYKVTCMIKTENVVPEEANSAIGAQISIGDSVERSVAIQGTTDWQKVEFLFNSKNRETIELGFRLGGYAGSCTGSAWFSDFEIEEGVQDTSKNWNFACFIFKTTDVVIEGKEININVTNSDVTDIKSTIGLFEKSCETLSKGKMTAKCDIYEVDEPLTELSYDEKFGYYVAAENVESQIKDTIKGSDYDHIFVIVRLGNEQYIDDIEINDWIGLGSMDYYGIGYSNIRLPNDSKSYVYKYNSRINTFPEEVFLHEFLHSLERTATEYNYAIPELHAYESYGYTIDRLNGQLEWYKDYMNQEIEDKSGNYVGLPKEVYNYKPAKSTNFVYPTKVENVFKQPENIVEEIIEIIERLKKKF